MCGRHLSTKAERSTKSDCVARKHNRNGNWDCALAPKGFARSELLDFCDDLGTSALPTFIQGFRGADTIAFAAEFAFRAAAPERKILKEFRDEILFAVWRALEEAQADR